MNAMDFTKKQYQAPTYRIEPDEAWFHFLHGNVPGHEIDFIYHPEVPQKPLTRQHVNHLVGLLKFIEPRQGMAYAFAIANLSLGDSQFDPGHGGVAFVFGLRIKGAYDHAGRNDPPFCHAAALINRHLDAETIYGVSAQFYQKLLPDEESRVEGSGWYHTYVDKAQNAEALPTLLRGYVQDFGEVLYTPPPSQLTLRWTVEPGMGEKVKVPRRMVVVYPDNADFATLTYCMARIAAVLVESDLRWTAISNGRETDIAGGMAVRFVPRREAENAPEDVVLLYLEQVPVDPAEIARLFGMVPARQSRLPELRVNIPVAPPPPPLDGPVNGVHGVNGVNGANGAHGVNGVHGAMHSVDVPMRMDVVAPAPNMGVNAGAETFDVGLPQRDVLKDLRRKERKQSTAMIAGVGLFMLALGIFALLWVLNAPRDVGEMMATAQPGASAAPVAPPRASIAAPTATSTTTAQAPPAPTAGSVVAMPETSLTAKVEPPAPTVKTTTKPGSGGGKRPPPTKTAPTSTIGWE